MDIICKHFHEKTGKKALPKAKKNIEYVKARKAEGYQLEDFLYVIDVKTDQWKGDATMDKYLRFETLFGGKMSGYINEQRGGTQHEPTQPPRILWG